MLLMCQEFSLIDTLRLWDALLAADAPGVSTNKKSEHSFQYLDFIAVALAQGVGLRIQYLNEFSACMELL